MGTYYSPGVYVEERSNLAPSVAQVATAIPVFIGYTEKGPKLTATRIDTQLDFENQFGRASPAAFKLTAAVGADGLTPEITKVERSDAASNKFITYYGVSLYYRNGGGSCYVISLGDYRATPDVDDFLKALKVLEREDEPTIIVSPDAVALLEATDYYSFCQEALAQCHTLGDRFLIVDVPKDQTAKAFRDDFSSPYPAFGAAYHPYLVTSLAYQYREAGVKIDRASAPAPAKSDTPAPAAPAAPVVPPAPNAEATANEPAAAPAEGSSDTGTKTAKKSDGDATSAETMASIASSSTALYNLAKTVLADQRVELPPSAAMAGVYVSVDRDRGVWKTPANVPLASVIGPVVKLSDAEQDGLNIDPNAGKSINAIRSFPGKGTLVWGGRTLAGNDNEWRYVSVRRLFLTIEESCRKASAFAVFEANDVSTWLKVKAMVESYLYGLWEQGALAGSKPEAAYFVNVGLGKSMTAQDILEGRMIVEIGVAAVRPAEFIILRFSHKLQEA